MDFKLPEIGEGVHEGELIRWLVKDGDTVQADQPVLEIMTDKATVEVPAPVAGQIKSLQGKEGDMLKVGQTLAQIAEGAGAAKAPAAAAPQSAASQATAPKVAPTQQTQAQPAPQKAAPAPQPQQMASSQSSGAYVGAMEAHSPSSVPAAPIVRAMAQRAGVNLDSVPGTGPDVGGRNRVLEEDLLRFMNSKDSGVSAPTRSSSNGNSYAQEVERKPLRGLRRVISNAMVKSKFTAPHYSYVDEFECSALVELREEAKRLAEKMDVKISYLPFIVKAVVGALKEFPVVNSSLEDKPDGSQEIVYKKFYNIGIAVATEEGLMVPVIKNADKKNIVEIAREMTDLSNRARAGKLAADDLKGSTFSITSMGNIGGLFATPIINYPEVGILGVYKVQEKALVEKGQIKIGKTMHLSLSLDHRVVDGAIGGYFCNAIIERLQNPARLLMELV